MKRQLPLNVLNGVVEPAKKRRLDRGVLFGSRARGDAGERSDVDFAIRGGDATEFVLDVDQEIATLLMFDVINLDRPVRRELLEEIAKDRSVLYEKV